MDYTRILESTLVGRHEGERPLGRIWRRWADIINMNFKEMGCESVDYFQVP
jgi:hypothetical protein